MRLFLFIFLCLAAVGGGIAWGVVEYQQSHKLTTKQIVDGLKGAGGSGEPASAQKPPDPPQNGDGTGGTASAKPPGERDKPPDPGPKNPPVSVARGTDPAMFALIGEAEQLYAKGQFASAKKKALQALSGSLAAEDRRRAESLQANAALFEALIAQVSSSDILPVDNRATVYLRNGGVIRGVLEKEESRGVEIRRDNGISAFFTHDQVERVEKQTREEVLEALEGEYAKREGALGGKPTGLDYYELAVFCIKNQLDARVPGLLEKAVALDRNLMQAATETKARIVYNVYQYFVKKKNWDQAELKRRELLSKYPESRYAKLVGKDSLIAKADPPKNDPPKNDPPTNDPPDPVDPADPGGGNGHVGPMPEFGNARVRALVERGNKAYDEGMTYLERSFDEANKSKDDDNMRALERFKAACAAYEEAVEIAWLNERLRQAGENRVMCFINAKSRR
jgi:tetratricopeptide (TPR) repeat protein